MVCHTVDVDGCPELGTQFKWVSRDGHPQLSHYSAKNAWVSPYGGAHSVDGIKVYEGQDHFSFSWEKPNK